MFVSVILVVSGCTSAPGIGGPAQSPAVTPTPTPSSPVSPAPTTVPAVTRAPTQVPAVTPQPGSLGSNPTPAPSPAPAGTPGITPTPGPTGIPSITLTPVPTVTPVISGQATDWGTDQDSYSRGSAATGWTYITNTGNVPVTQVDFTVTVKRSMFGFPIEKSYSYSKAGLNIAPGEKQKVEFSQTIPAEYSGMSTAGDYQFVVTAALDGKEIGSFNKNIKIV